MSTIFLKIEFGGGLELLSSNQRSHRISIPARVPLAASTSAAGSAEPTEGSTNADTNDDDGNTKRTDVTYLIHWLKDNLLKERPELFVENDTVRPGILVLINDADWELEGEGDYVLKDGDEIVFISTLHGG